MWVGNGDHGWFEWLAFFTLVVVLGYYVSRIDQRIRLVKMRLDRLSVTFLKIENDLTAIQDCLLVMSKDGAGSFALVSKLRDRRNDLLRDKIENGPNAAEILRGLEFPDIDDDPLFWSADRMIKLGLGPTDGYQDDKDGPK